MSQDALIQVMAAFVVLSALAMILQFAMLAGIFRTLRRIREQLDGFRPRVDRVLDSAERTLEQSRRQFQEVTAKTNAVLDSTRTQLDRIDGVLADATARVRVQMDRVEVVFDDTVRRVHQTVTLLNDGILRPIREVNGVAVGVRAAFLHLMRGSRPNVDQVTTDEEMFI